MTLIIGGMLKQSLIDYPGRLSAVVFLSGCNMACPYCHNPDLATGSRVSRTGTAELLTFLKARTGFLDGVVLSGGEPTLQHGLADFCGQVHRLGYAIKLDTNGTRPGYLSRLISEKLIDYVAMDLKTLPERYGELARPPVAPDALHRSIDLIMTSGLEYEFRTTCTRPFVDVDTVCAIAGRIRGARLYALQRFRADAVLDPAFFTSGDSGFDDAGMRELQSAAAPMVKRCIVR